MLQVERVDKKDGRIEEGKTIAGGAFQVGHKVRVKGKKNRVGAPYRVAEFSLKYDSGIVNVAEETYELAKSLGVIYHPISTNTGKPNNMMWQFADYPAVKGETNMKFFITSDEKVLKEVYNACLGIKDDSVLAARNESLSSTNINLEEL